jgi:hypothetical protein
VKQVDDEYGGGVNRLTGAVAACALTGNGGMNLAVAGYRVRVQRSDAARYQQVIKNIMAKWEGQFRQSGMSYTEYCRSALEPFNAGRLRSFIETVFAEFSQSSGDPATSTNYLELVALNTGGEPLTVCGQDPAGAGSVPCP